MNKITEIIPDDMPEWAKEAMAGGQLWNRVFGRIEELQARVKFLEAEIDDCENNEDFYGHSYPTEQPK